MLLIPFSRTFLTAFSIVDCSLKHGIIIETKNFTYTVFEDYQKILKTYYKKKILYKTKLFKIPLQSKLTNIIVDELLKKNIIGIKCF